MLPGPAIGNLATFPVSSLPCIASQTSLLSPLTMWSTISAGLTQDLSLSLSTLHDIHMVLSADNQVVLPQGFMQHTVPSM